MKKDKRLTELYLLPLNLCFLSFFGIFLAYELDKWFMASATQTASFLTISLSALATIFLASSLKFRNAVFHGVSAALAIVALVILF